MKKIILFTLLFLFGVSSLPDLRAQCPMCKSAVESAMKDDKNTKGRGLNKGILYLLSAPYLAVGIIGVGWYMNSKKKKKNLND